MLKCSVQLCSVTQSCLTLYNPMDCSTPGFPVHHQLPEFAQTHVHQVSDAIQPSHPLALHLSHHVRLFATLWYAAHQAFLSIINSWSLLKSMPIKSVMPFNHLILCCLFASCLQPFPASECFPMSQFFTSDGESIGASDSASVLAVNIQDWFPLWWTGWISLLSKGLSGVFTNTTVQKHQFFSTQLCL